MVFPGQLFVSLFDLQQGSGFGYSKEVVEAQSGGGGSGSGFFRDEVIVDGGLGLGFEGSGFGGNEKGYVGLGWDLGSGWEIEEAGLASSEW